MTRTSKQKVRESRGPVRDLIDELQALDEQHQMGDVRDKAYQRQRDELLAQIGREKCRAILEHEEKIVGEHHYVQSHFPFAKLSLQDTAQESWSFYLTDRRLFRWHFVERPFARAASLGNDDNLECIWLLDIQGIARRKEYRMGEAAIAAIMILLAVLLWPILTITGPGMALVGALALIHVAAMPTRYLSIATGLTAEPEWRIYAVRKKSGRALVYALQEEVDSLPQRDKR
jgi:hypothetical protein